MLIKMARRKFVERKANKEIEQRKNVNFAFQLLSNKGINGWQLAKMKEYSWHFPAMKFIGMKQLV